MCVQWAVFLPVFVAASQVLGSVHPGKRSDYTMYDNQFYRVGDSELDDEVTDCALVDHQFRHGFIRLREYLERKRGCGRKGKLSNIQGIAKSTEDDINVDNINEIAKSTTEDYHYTPPSPAPAVKKAPKRPKGLPQVINSFKPHKMAYVPRRYPVTASLKPATQPVLQEAVQRNNYPARPNSPLSSYTVPNLNPAIQPNRQAVVQRNQPARPNSPLGPFTGNYKPVKQPVIQAAVQRNYPAKPSPLLVSTTQHLKPAIQTVQQAAVQRGHPARPRTSTPLLKPAIQPAQQAAAQRNYAAKQSSAQHLKPAIQPVVQAAVQRNHPASLDEYQQDSQHSALSFSKNPSAAAIVPASLDHTAYETENTLPAHMASAFSDQYTRLASSYDQINPQAERKHDLLRTFYPSTPREPAAQETSIVTVGQPLYKQTAIVQTHARNQAPAPKAAPNKVSSLLKNAMSNFNSFAGNKFVAAKTAAQQQNYKKPAINPVQNAGPGADLVDDTEADMRDPIKDGVKNIVGVEPGPQAAINAATAQKPSGLPLIQRPGQELRPDKPATSLLNGFAATVAPKVAPAPQKVNPAITSQPQNTLTDPVSPAVLEDSSLPHPSINLDVLKNKILHSTNATFLRRMLTLIRKITHHKDFQKLNAPARSFVSQANTAVQAMNKVYNENAAGAPLPQESGNQIYGQDYALSKKFQIARNPYYQNYYRYRQQQPYYSNLQTMGYGWYNGNVP